MMDLAQLAGIVQTTMLIQDVNRVVGFFNRQNQTSAAQPSVLNNINTVQNNNLGCRASTAQCIRRPSSIAMTFGIATFVSGCVAGGQLGGNHPISATLQIAGGVIAAVGAVVRLLKCEPGMRVVQEQNVRVNHNRSTAPVLEEVDQAGNDFHNGHSDLPV